MEPLSPKIIMSISSLLQNDRSVIRNLLEIADNLDVSEEVKITYCNSGMKPMYECLKAILSDWVAKHGSNATLERLKDVLRELGFNNAADMISDFEYTTDAQQKQYERINIVRPVSRFTGRNEELCRLTEWYDSAAKMNPVIVIAGMGGMGKTELVRCFLDKHRQTRNCAWLNGDGSPAFVESLEDLIKKSHCLQRLMGHSFDELCRVAKSSVWGEWLLIVDGVDLVFQALVEFVVMAISQGAVFIVTGRTLDTFPGECDLLRLEPLTLMDAKGLFLNYIGCREEEDSDLTDICVKLGCHPLALTQAAAYIKMQRQKHNSSYTIKDYIKKFSALKLNTQLSLSNNSYSKTLITVFSQSLSVAKWQAGLCAKCVEIALVILALVKQDRIEHQNFLKLFTAVPHNIEIKDQEAAGQMICPLQADEAIAALSSKVSLVRQDGDWISTHSLIQAITLEKLDWMWVAESILKYGTQLKEADIDFTTKELLESVELRLKTALGTMNLKDAKQLVSKHLGSEEEEIDLNDICVTCGCQPQTLIKAATYITNQRQMRKSGYSIKDYIEEFHSPETHQEAQSSKYCETDSKNTEIACPQGWGLFINNSTYGTDMPPRYRPPQDLLLVEEIFQSFGVPYDTYADVADHEELSDILNSFLLRFKRRKSLRLCMVFVLGLSVGSTVFMTEEGVEIMEGLLLPFTQSDVRDVTKVFFIEGVNHSDICLARLKDSTQESFSNYILCPFSPFGGSNNPYECSWFLKLLVDVTQENKDSLNLQRILFEIKSRISYDDADLVNVQDVKKERKTSKETFSWISLEERRYVFSYFGKKKHVQHVVPKCSTDVSSIFEENNLISEKEKALSIPRKLPDQKKHVEESEERLLLYESD